MMKSNLCLLYGNTSNALISLGPYYPRWKFKDDRKENPNFKWYLGLSEPLPEDNWDGETGLITDVLDRHISSGEHTEGYLCGSPGMIDAAIAVLSKKGIGEDKIFYDKFA